MLPNTYVCIYASSHTLRAYWHAYAIAAFADPGAGPRAPPAENRRSLRSTAINVPSTASSNNNNNNNNNNNIINQQQATTRKSEQQ